MNPSRHTLYVLLFILNFQFNQYLFSQPMEEWVRTFNSWSTNQDYVSDMKMDKAGNIYMCGYVKYDSQNSDALLLKYNSSGELQWSRTYNGRGTFSNDKAEKIIINDSGYIYLMGTVQFNTILDYLVMKYRSNGDTVWTRSFDGGNGETDDPTDMVIDDNHNIYVTGKISRKGNTDIGTLKYDMDGNLKWASKISYASQGNLLLRSGFVFVSCGLYQDTVNRNNYSILKYDTLGLLLDTINYGVSVNGGKRFMIFDLEYNFIMSSEFDGGISTRLNILTAKITAGGIGKWTSIFDNNHNTISGETIKKLQTDLSNNIYLLAGSLNQSYMRADVALIKYSTEGGDTLWIKRYSSVPFATDIPSDMSIDQNNNIYIVGSSDFNLINNRFITLKYNSDGQLLWHKEYTPSVFVNSEGLRILNDSSGNLLVAGITNSSSTGDDIVLIKYSHITSTEESNIITVPSKYELYQNYPNPFNSQTQIKFDILKDNRYKLEIFDVLGRLVSQIFDESKKAGNYNIIYDASILSSGIYIYKLSSDDFSMIKKFTLIK